MSNNMPPKNVNLPVEGDSILPAATDKGFDYRNSTSTGNNNNSKTAFDYRDEEGPTSHSYGKVEYEDGHNSKNVGIELGYLPPDQRPGLPGELLAQLVDPEIDEDTEAAEALRANATVKVGKVGKVARSLNAQSVRKVAKRLTLRGQSGNRRGKPPRIPPGLNSSHVESADGGIQVTLLALDEEASADLDDASSISGGSVDHRFNQEGGSVERIEPDVAAAAAGMPAPDKYARVKNEGSGTSPIHQPHQQHNQHQQHHHYDGRHTQNNQNKAGHPRNSSAMEDAKDIPAEVVAATMEAGRKLMGALDPHNMLQLQRWRRKNKKGGRKKRKSYVKGKVIDGRHELYTLSIAVMLGVRTSIARTNTIIASSDRKTLLTPLDFMAEEKYEFSPKGSSTTPRHKLSHTFKFKDYGPVAFAYLRRLFGVNEFDFLLSVCGNANFIEFISNAKSGQFFFYSSDGKYMIKTMTNAESKFLRRILPHYFRHCTQNPNTLITRFLGMYRVKLYHLRRNVKFVIMNSVYYTDKSLQEFFDLKGSELGRSADHGQDVLKDNDLRAKLPEEAFSIPTEMKDRLRGQIISDCQFMRRMQIMDYSMLIGIHHLPPKSDDTGKRGATADTGLRIKERQTSIRGGRAREDNHGSDAFAANAAAVRAEHNDGGSHTDGESIDAENKVAFLKDGKADSSRKLIKDIRESAGQVTNFEFAGLLDDDDDCSYLEGSEKYKEGIKDRDTPRYSKGMYDDVEIKKEQTVEQIYWPFHRFYDINGFRRMKPKPCFRCNTTPCNCEGHAKLVKAWKIPDFTPPLSDRKDGGLTMDTDGLPLPMTWHGPQGDRAHEGKIYFMGIIDILQQYNARKRVETTYRKTSTRGGLEPSCVSPREYAERFVVFFDEYAKKASLKPADEGEKTEVEVSIGAKKEDVQISVTTPGERDEPEPPKYEREPRKERSTDGKLVPPKGRFVVS